MSEQDKKPYSSLSEVKLNTNESPIPFLERKSKIDEEDASSKKLKSARLTSETNINVIQHTGGVRVRV